MHAAPTGPDDDACDRAKRIARQSSALQHLAEAGLQLTRALVDEVAAGREGRFRGVDPALAYSRLARAIRLTIALEARLGEDGAGRAAAESGAEAAELEAEAEAEPVIETEAAERGERPERERFDEQHSDAALLSRPNGEVYARICRDLGTRPEPGLFPDLACNDDEAEDACDTAATAAAAPAGNRSAGARASLLRSAAAAPLAGLRVADAPYPRPPP
jgi:hypothetical protein